jgi:uncharacterized protein with GYD domain
MTMATYVVLARFTAQGVKNAKDSPKRAEAFKQMAETFGVTVKDIFWTQGRYDIVIVIDAPDELSATALNLSLSALGNIRTESLRAFSSTDMLKIVAKCSNPAQSVRGFAALMSALGQKRTSAARSAMSALCQQQTARKLRAFLR